MEKMVMIIGFGIVCVSFFLCLCIGTQFAWGVPVGIIPTWLGMYYCDN